MKNYKQLSNSVFLEIVVLASIFLIILAFISFNLLSQVSLFISTIPNQVKSVCGCVSYSTFENHPFIFIGISLLFGLIVFFIISFIYKIYKLKRITDKFVNFNLSRKKNFNSRKLMNAIKTIDLKNKVIEVEMDQPVAFCYSFLHSKICISSRLVQNLNRKELEAVLLHEKMHILNKDTIKIFVVKAVEKMIFFLPNFRKLTSKYFLYSELSADEHATFGFSKKTYLARALYKSIKMEENIVQRNNAISVSFFEITTERISRLQADNFSLHKESNMIIFIINVLFLISIMFFYLFLNTNLLQASSTTEINSCISEKNKIYYECNSSCSFSCEMNSFQHSAEKESIFKDTSNLNSKCF